MTAIIALLLVAIIIVNIFIIAQPYSQFSKPLLNLSMPTNFNYVVTLPEISGYNFLQGFGILSTIKAIYVVV